MWLGGLLLTRGQLALLRLVIEQLVLLRAALLGLTVLIVDRAVVQMRIQVHLRLALPAAWSAQLIGCR
jgi:hypothetical protein